MRVLQWDRRGWRRSSSPPTSSRRRATLRRRGRAWHSFRLWRSRLARTPAPSFRSRPRRRPCARARASVVGRDDAAAIAGVAGVAGGAACAVARVVVRDASGCGAGGARGGRREGAAGPRNRHPAGGVHDAQQVLLFVNGMPKGYSRPRFPDVKTRRERPRAPGGRSGRCRCGSRTSASAGRSGSSARRRRPSAPPPPPSRRPPTPRRCVRHNCSVRTG